MVTPVTLWQEVQILVVVDVEVQAGGKGNPNAHPVDSLLKIQHSSILTTNLILRVFCQP